MTSNKALNANNGFHELKICERLAFLQILEGDDGDHKEALVATFADNYAPVVSAEELMHIREFYENNDILPEVIQRTKCRVS